MGWNRPMEWMDTAPSLLHVHGIGCWNTHSISKNQKRLLETILQSFKVSSVCVYLLVIELLDMLELLCSNTECESRVWHCSWSKNGYFATSGEDKMIRIWSVIHENSSYSLSCIATLEEGQSRTIRSIEWSPDGRIIASASFDGTVVLWQTLGVGMKKWEQIASLEGHDSEVKSVGWSTDGSFLATCGRDKKVWVWERISDTEFECVGMLESHTQDVKFIKWHPTHRVLFSASYDDTIKVWVEDNDDWYCSQTLQGHSSTVWAISIDDTGTKMVSCSDDRSVILWESSSNNATSQWNQLAKINDVHSYPIYSCDWNKYSNYIVSGGGDNSIVILQYGVSDGLGQVIVECRTEEAHDSDINCVRWNPIQKDSDLLLSTSDDGAIRLWRWSM